MARSNYLCERSVAFRSAKTEDGDGRNLDGYAAVFDTPTEINSYEGIFEERISSGAFTKTLRENPKPVMQFDHGKDARVGSTPIGAYSALEEDPHGLHVMGRLFDNPVVEPVRQAIAADALQMSFRFRVLRDSWTDKDGNAMTRAEVRRYLYDPQDRGPLQRNVQEVQLFECGPVVFGAYPTTTVGVRSLAEMTDEDRSAMVAEYARTADLADTADAVEEREATPEADSATLAPDESKDIAVDASPETATEDAARSGTSSGSDTKRVIPAMRRVIPDLPAPCPR